MRARKNADLADDGPNRLHVASVDALSLGQNVITNDMVFSLFELVFDELFELGETRSAKLGGERLHELGLRGLVRVVAGFLVLDERRGQNLDVANLLGSSADG